MHVAKFMGLTFPCNLFSISRSRFSGGGEALGSSPHIIPVGPTRHREGGLGALPQERSGKTSEEPHRHLQGTGGQEAEADTLRQRALPQALGRPNAEGDMRHRGA